MLVGEAPETSTPPDTRPERLWTGLLFAAAVAIALVVIVFVESSRSSGIVPAGPAGTVPVNVSSAYHVNRPVEYSADPPAGGDHFDVWQNCGVYEEPLIDELVVHSLEHGAVWVTYPQDFSSAEVAQLQEIVRNAYLGRERYIILSPYEGLSDEVVASAWGLQLRVSDVADSRLPAFLEQFAGGPQSPETLFPCTGGVGTPLD